MKSALQVDRLASAQLRLGFVEAERVVAERTAYR